MTILSMSITDRANWPSLFLLPSVSVICNFIRFSQNYFFCHNYPHPLVNFFFCSCYKFNVSLFPYIVHSLSGHWLFIIFKNSFSKTFMSFVLSSVFVSTYDFNHAFWLNSIMLRSFLIFGRVLFQNNKIKQGKFDLQVQKHFDSNLVLFCLRGQITLNLLNRRTYVVSKNKNISSNSAANLITPTFLLTRIKIFW